MILVIYQLIIKYYPINLKYYLLIILWTNFIYVILYVKLIIQIWFINY